MNLREFYNTKIKYSPKLYEDDLAVGFLDKCENVLDIGCGSGRFMERLPGETVGLEGNRESVARCRERGLNVIEGKADVLPFQDNYFAGVNCSHLIEHLTPDDAYKLLLEIDRVLKPGGIVCLRAPMFHKNFFDEFGHIKPYPPKAILTYFNKESDGTQAQYKEIKGKYDLLKLHYQRSNIFDIFAGTVLAFLTAVGNILLRFGITGREKISYVMILKKIK